MFCNTDKIKCDDYAGLCGLVKTLVKEKRYAHILGVEQEAAKMAGIFGCGGNTVKKLKTAALLHDITKEFDMQKQLEICREYKIKLSTDDKRAPKAVHAKTGAYIARLEFGADETVFGAIYNHTIGDPSAEPGLFDKIIYLADWTEPNRDYGDCAAVREYFYSGVEAAANMKEKYIILDKTMLFACNKSIEALIRDNLYIHGDAIKRRNALIIKNITV